jgi:hypothetical protein
MNLQDHCYAIVIKRYKEIAWLIDRKKVRKERWSYHNQRIHPGPMTIVKEASQDQNIKLFVFTRL